MTEDLKKQILSKNDLKNNESWRFASPQYFNTLLLLVESKKFAS